MEVVHRLVEIFLMALNKPMHMENEININGCETASHTNLDCFIRVYQHIMPVQ